MHFAGIKHHKIPFVEDHRFLLLAFGQKSDVFLRQPVGLRLSSRQGTEGHPLDAAEHNLNIEIAGMVFRAARGLRLGGIFGNQIKQVIAVDIVFTQRRRLADMGDDVLNGLAQRGRQPWLQMVDIANNHHLPRI